MSRVLLTGAGGFIGAPALTALTAAGHDVHAVSSRPRLDGAGATWHTVDLLDPVAVTALARELSAERLLHLAWYTEHGRYWQAPENLRWVQATLGLLAAFQAAGGTRAVLAGTCAEYDWSHPVLSETSTPLAPATLYGTAKHATHLVAQGWAEQVCLSLAWGRVFFLYGPGEAGSRLVPAVATALLAGRQAEVTSGEQTRDFMYVDDVAAAFVALLDSPVTGAVNVASGEELSVREFVEALALQTGRPELVRYGALPTRAGEPPRLVADVTRLRDEVGFASSVPLASGLARTVDWWRARTANEPQP